MTYLEQVSLFVQSVPPGAWLMSGFNVWLLLIAIVVASRVIKAMLCGYRPPNEPIEIPSLVDRDLWRPLVPRMAWGVGVVLVVLWVVAKV